MLFIFLDKSNFMKKASFILIPAIILSLIVIQNTTDTDIKTINPKSFPKAYGMMNPEKRLERDVKMLADPRTGQIPKGIRKKELLYAQTLPKQYAHSRNGNHEWEAQGPFNIGGRTRAFAMDINNENILIAGGNSGAIWRSTDGGSSWAQTETPYTAVGASCIAQDTRTGKTSTWYVGTGERYSSASSGLGAIWLGDGVLKSIDNGLTWDTLSSTRSNSPQAFNAFDKIWNIALNPASSEDQVYVATPTAIYKSTDGGDSWNATLTSTQASAYSYSDIMCTPSGVLYATFSSDGSGRGIWRSTDGDNWTRITPSEIGNSYNRIISAYVPTDENVVYFLANSPGSGKETFNFLGDSEWNSLLKYEYLSGNGSDTGGAWTNLSDNLPIGPELFDDFNVQGSYDMVLEIKPNDPNVIIAGGTNLYRSTDGFTTPGNVTHIGGYVRDTKLPLFDIVTNHHPDQHVVFFSENNPEVMYSGHDGGLSKTDDIMASTVLWESLNKGYQTTQFYTIAIDHGTEGSNTVIGGLQDNGTLFSNTVGDTSNWNMSFSYDGAFCAIEDGGDMYYMSIQLGRIVKLTLDNMGNMTAYRRIDPIVPDPDVYDFINPLVLDPTDNNTMYVAAGTKLYRNNDLSSLQLTNEWDSINDGWDELSGTTQGFITAFGTTHSGSKRLYIGTDAGRVYRLDSATTGDPTFTSISSGLTSGFVSCVEVDPRDDNKIIVVYSNYNKHSVYYTENGGNKWWRISGNMEGEPLSPLAPDTYYDGPYPSCRWAEIIPVEDGKTVYLLGTSVGLFATDTLILGSDYDTDTTTWVQQSPNNIGGSIINMMDHRVSDNYVAIGTHGSGVFTKYVTHSWGITGQQELKENSSLLKLFPNPATDYFNIESNKNKIQAVSIINMEGKHVLELNRINNTQSKISVSELTKGYYICNVILDNGQTENKFFVKQ